MGELIMMPVRSNETADAETENSRNDALQGVSGTEIDFSAWKTAPKERTQTYFPTYAAISKAMQTALRGWVREWFHANPEILLRPYTAYPILVYQCTHPFSGKPTNIFTYDIQETAVLNRAFASAANKMGRELKSLDTKKLTWFKREHYFAYRSKNVVTQVMKNRRAIYKMLHVETMLMNSILKFAIIDIAKLGLEESVVLLRRAFNTWLRRFSDEFDMSARAEELLRIATETLAGKLPNENVIEMPIADFPQAA